jgi:small-conductance mechanosensitive channel
MFLEKIMVRVLLFLLFFFQPVESLASASFLLPESPATESSPQSQEIKKIAKLLENPLEREKLLKTLKVLAAAQEADEKKKGGSLVSYFMPIIQLTMDSGSTFWADLKKVPLVVYDLIDYLKIGKNRDDFWAALMWFPLLVLIGGFLEILFIWCFKLRLKEIGQKMQAREFANNKSAYALMTLFFPFLCPLLALPLAVPNREVGNWIMGLWLLLFVIRIFLLERKALPILPLPTEEPASKKGPFLIVLAGVGLWALVVMGMKISLGIKNYGKDFIFNLILLMSYPLLVLYFREWRVKKMPGYLEDSKILSTVPKRVARLLNLFIRYLPWLLLFIGIPVVIDKVFIDGNLWKNYGLESLGSLGALAIFLGGRHRIEMLAHYKMPKVQAVKVQAFTSYVATLRIPFAKGLQWIWHLSFFAIMMAIWNYCFSDFFISIFSHSMTKTMTTIAMLWGIIYLLWLGLDFFVQFHTKPQAIKGKRREPTVFAKTFGPMLHSVARWIMVLVTIFVTLESFGFDLKVLVYLMSAFAFAISLGSQSLVKDIINGFFALIDGSFAVGDVVTVGAYTGAVESLSLRAITLRHGTGFLQTIPFSEVGSIINKSRNYNVVPIDVATSYKTEIGTVHEALTKAAEDMATHPVFGKMILEPLSVSGVDRFADTAVHISASIKILPDPHNNFAREFNRRLKIHMDALKIIPPTSFQEPWGKL